MSSSLIGPSMLRIKKRSKNKGSCEKIFGIEFKP